MVLDYSGRRPVPKNRPRKQPVGIFAVILISAVSMSFALGVLTGWFVFRPAKQAEQGELSGAAAGKGATEGSSPQPQYPNPEMDASKGLNPPLTFYETLPKGGKAIIGSGLNPPKSIPPQPPKPQPALQQAPVQETAKPAAPAKQEEQKGQAQPPVEQGKNTPVSDTATAPKQPNAAGKFCVQIASTQDRKEAEALQAKLAGKGLPVYVLESKIKDRGTWYRVRVGKHLSQQAAGELAGKAGKGAMVVPE